jgi:hypothetical protein
MSLFCPIWLRVIRILQKKKKIAFYVSVLKKPCVWIRLAFLSRYSCLLQFWYRSNSTKNLTTFTHETYYTLKYIRITFKRSVMFRNNNHCQVRAQSKTDSYTVHSSYQERFPLLKTQTLYRSSCKQKSALLIIYTFFTVQFKIQQGDLLRHDNIYDCTAGIVHNCLQC